MTQQSRTTLKGYFETGDVPTQAQFENLIDSSPNIADDYGVQFAEVELSAAQILNLNTSPVEIVAAPGAGKVIIPNKWVFYSIYGTSAYETNTTLTLVYEIAAKLAASYGSAIAQTNNLIGNDVIGFGWLDTDIINKPLSISVNSGNPTGGDGTLRYMFGTQF